MDIIVIDYGNGIRKVVVKEAKLTKEAIEEVANGEAGPERRDACALLDFIKDGKLVLEP